MEPNTAVLSFVISSLICFPIYRYFYRAAKQNDEQYDTAHKKEFGEDSIDSLLDPINSSAEGFAQDHFFATLFLLFIPFFYPPFLRLGFMFCWRI